MGHVDGVGQIHSLAPAGEGWSLEIECPDTVKPFVAAKGSVAVDGVSLTPAQVTANRFTVAIIPHTYENTSLKAKRAGSPVNLEADLIARYVVHHLTAAAEGGGVSAELLERAGLA